MYIKIFLDDYFLRTSTTRSWIVEVMKFSACERVRGRESHFILFFPRSCSMMLKKTRIIDDAFDAIRSDNMAPFLRLQQNTKSTFRFSSRKQIIVVAKLLSCRRMPYALSLSSFSLSHLNVWNISFHNLNIQYKTHSL